MKSLLVISIIFQLLFISDTPQAISRGELLLNQPPTETEKYIDNGYLNLYAIRETCNFLTDHNIELYEGDTIPRRKNAFIRHIKHLNEQLEEAYLDNKPVDNEIHELLFELVLFEYSLKQKTSNNANPDPNLFDKADMWWDTQRSNCLFKYDHSITNHEAQNIDPQNLQNDPNDSPYWHKANSEVPLNKRFGQLAKLKKIKAKENMVVLFDKLSYDGSAPKIDVLDTDLDNGWVLKWGDEIHTDIAGSRIFAALGYDVDHPYFYGEDQLTLVLDSLTIVKNSEDLIFQINQIYQINLTPFISTSGIITDEMILQNDKLAFYEGQYFVRFIKCGLEGRPDRVKRIGSFIPDGMMNDGRRELRGALLAHQWIGNWDTREQNTLLTQVHMGNYKYRISAVFSDLGTSFGVVQHYFPPDFKVGLVNEFSWEVASIKNDHIYLKEEINSILPPYALATYNDLLWMANKIATIDSTMLRDIVNDAHWPPPVGELYFHKLASRRASILNAFQITDLHPITFDKHLNYSVNGEFVVKDGVLLREIDLHLNPEGFISDKGRFRNYGYAR